MSRRNAIGRFLLAVGLGLATALAAVTTSFADVGFGQRASGTVLQQDDEIIQPLPRPIYVYAGVCGELGDIQWPLNNLTSPDGERGGPEDADRTEYSFTANVPLTIDKMLDGEYAINVHESGDEFDSTLVCGNIGGVPDGVGTLVVGLREHADSGVTGIAVLSPSPSNPAMTYASVFISGEALGDEIGTIGVTPPASAEDTPPVSADPPVDTAPPPGGDDDDDGDDDDGDDDDGGDD
jgi:hypothetical protein